MRSTTEGAGPGNNPRSHRSGNEQVTGVEAKKSRGQELTSKEDSDYGQLKLRPQKKQFSNFITTPFENLLNAEEAQALSLGNVHGIEIQVDSELESDEVIRGEKKDPAL